MKSNSIFDHSREWRSFGIRACLHLSGSGPPPSTPIERSICKCFAAVALALSDTFGTKYELSTKYEVSTPEL